jgi:Tfp pilus assembly protein PilF
VVIKILAAAGTFFILWLLVYLTIIFLQKKSQRRKLGSLQFPLPAPVISEEDLKHFREELEKLGFSLRQQLTREQFKLWPSSCWNFFHEKFPSYSDLTIFPTGNILILFISEFPKGYIVTAYGGRESSIHFFPGESKIRWEPGSLSEVWNAHQKYVQEYVTTYGRAPLSPTKEKHADYLKKTQHHLKTLLTQEKLNLRTVGDYLTAGYLYLHELKTSESLEMFQGAINLFPDFSPLYRLVGKISLYLSRYDDAAQYFYEALDLDPSDQDSYLLLSKALSVGDKKKIAYNLLKKGAATFPKNLEIKLQLGILGVQLGFLEEVKPFLMELEKESNSSAVLLNLLSEFYKKSGNSIKAREYSQSAKTMKKGES